MDVSRKKGLVPDYVFRDVLNITPDFLEKLGIKFLMMDLDNTIAAYDEHVLSSDIKEWLSNLKSSGIELFIISNSTREKRVTTLSDSVGIAFTMRAGKPSCTSLIKAMDSTNHKPYTSALVGDQIFTDGLAAKRAGITSIVIRPKRFTNPFLFIRYIIELPIRALCKNK